MTTAPILQLVDPNLEYIVTCDASDFIVGALLSQIHDDREHPIVVESREMNPTERAIIQLMKGNSWQSSMH